MTHRFPLWIYLTLFSLQIAAFVGAAYALVRILPRSRVDRAICVVTGIFVAWVLLVYSQYNWAHYTPQGRYFFVLLAPFGMLMAGGMKTFLRRFVASRKGQRVAWVLIGLFLVCLNVYALWVMPTSRGAVQVARVSNR
jgi:hypothetical protein